MDRDLKVCIGKYRPQVFGIAVCVYRKIVSVFESHFRKCPVHGESLMGEHVMTHEQYLRILKLFGDYRITWRKVRMQPLEYNEIGLKGVDQAGRLYTTEGIGRVENVPGFVDLKGIIFVVSLRFFVHQTRILHCIGKQRDIMSL